VPNLSDSFPEIGAATDITPGIMPIKRPILPDVRSMTFVKKNGIKKKFPEFATNVRKPVNTFTLNCLLLNRFKSSIGSLVFFSYHTKKPKRIGKATNKITTIGV